ncbi:hypothetical protein POM88_053465 [Heracleum sosnowskyi]|uniref:Uncharacterized protein n=1 Tax=Heracleum sosnowskyi TaxID=360622 RepID=A0AAD8LWZ5_9APIA|nr:hypothetical protein POM88_053465 [Heracleum sosnowskyi]
MSPSFETSPNSGRQEQNQLLSHLGHDTKNFLSLGEVGNASDISGPRNVESRNASLTMGSRNYITSVPSLQSSFMSYRSQPSGRGLVQSRLPRNFNDSTNASFISRGNFSTVYTSTPIWPGTSHSTISRIQPQGLIPGGCINEGGRSSVPSVIRGQEKGDNMQSMQEFRRYGDYQSNSTLLLGQEKKEICSSFRTPVIPLSRKDDGSFLMLNNASPNHDHSEACYQELHQGIQNPPQMGLFPSWSSSSKLKTLDQQHFLQTRNHSAQMNTMRTFTPVNSVVGASQGPLVISDRSLPNEERVNASFCKENRLPEKYDEVVDLNKESCQLFGHSQQGVKLQPLDTPTGSGGITSVQHPSAFQFVSKNELSAEGGSHVTDIQENHLSGAKPFPVNKDARTYVSSEELWSKPVIPGIPDLNIPLPAMEPTTKTRRKRKMSDILNSGNSAQQEIINKSFRQIKKGKRTKSELTFAGKEVIDLDLLDDGPSSKMDCGSSSKELIEVEKKTSDKNGKTPSGPKPCNK